MSLDAAPRIVRARADVAVWEVGAGDPVLVLHGFPDTAQGMRPLVERLVAAGFRAIVPALPGYPPSGPVDDYRTSSVAADMVAVLDALAVDRAAVVDHDWGGLVAYDLGAAHPNRIARIAALAVPHPSGFAVRRRDLQEQKTAAYAWILAFSSGAAALAADPVWLDQIHAEWSPGLTRPEWPAVKALLAQAGVGDAIHGWYRDDMARDDLTGDVRVPALVLHGTQDGCIGPACYRAIAERFAAGAEIAEIAGVGHWLHVEEPDAIAARIVSFLRTR